MVFRTACSRALGTFSVALLALLSACGGGNGEVRGLAATGAALANAPVQARCVGGAPWQGRTDEEGRFAFSGYSGRT
ncbi:MAG: hypothetical protein ACT4NV_10765 [Rhodoferax sp.]